MSSSSMRYFYSPEDLLKLSVTDNEFCDIPERFMKIDISFRRKCEKKECLFAKLPIPNCVNLPTKDLQNLNLCPIHTNRYYNNKNSKNPAPQSAPKNDKIDAEDPLPKQLIDIDPAIQSDNLREEINCPNNPDNLRNDNNDLVATEKNNSFELFIKKLKERKKSEEEGADTNICPTNNYNPSTISNNHQKSCPSDSTMLHNNLPNISLPNNCQDHVRVIDPDCPVHRNMIKNPSLMFTPASVEKRLSQRIPLNTPVDSPINPWMYQKAKHQIHHVCESSGFQNPQNNCIRQPSFHNIENNQAIYQEDYNYNQQHIHTAECRLNHPSNSTQPNLDPKVAMILRKLGHRGNRHDLARMYNFHHHANDFSNNYSLNFTPEEVDTYHPASYKAFNCI